MTKNFLKIALLSGLGFVSTNAVSASDEVLNTMIGLADKAVGASTYAHTADKQVTAALGFSALYKAHKEAKKSTATEKSARENAERETGAVVEKLSNLREETGAQLLTLKLATELSEVSKDAGDQLAALKGYIELLAAEIEKLRRTSSDRAMAVLGGLESDSDDAVVGSTATTTATVDPEAENAAIAEAITAFEALKATYNVEAAQEAFNAANKESEDFKNAVATYDRKTTETAKTTALDEVKKLLTDEEKATLGGLDDVALKTELDKLQAKLAATATDAKTILDAANKYKDLDDELEGAKRAVDEADEADEAGKADAEALLEGVKAKVKSFMNDAAGEKDDSSDSSDSDDDA